MKKIHTPWQYLLDIVGQQRLAQAEASGNQEDIAQAKRFYTDLDESECTFTEPYQHPDNPKIWFVSMTCLGRGFKINRLKFNTGDLKLMLEPNTQYITNRNSLNLSTTPNMYHVLDSLDTFHLLVAKDTPVLEALVHTGFRFNDNEFTEVKYDARDAQFEANGHIDIRTPVVAGRIYVTNIIRDLDKEAEEARLKAIGHQAPIQDPIEESVVEESIPTVTVQDQIGETQQEQSEEGQVQSEEPETVNAEEEKEEVKPQSAQQQFQNFNQKKKK